MDVLECYVKEQVLHTERLLTIRQNVPKFMEKLFPSSEPVSYVHETTVVDLKSKNVRAVSRNLTFRELMTMEERVEYSSRNNSTTFTQEAAVTVNLRHFSNYLEDIVLNRFKANAAKGKQALEQVLDSLFNVSFD